MEKGKRWGRGKDPNNSFKVKQRERERKREGGERYKEKSRDS